MYNRRKCSRRSVIGKIGAAGAAATKGKWSDQPHEGTRRGLGRWFDPVRSLVLWFSGPNAQRWLDRARDRVLDGWTDRQWSPGGNSKVVDQGIVKTL